MNPLHLAAAAGAGLAVTGAMLRWPPARKRLLSRRITKYQIKTGCRRAWPAAPSYMLPYVLSVTSTHYGEFVQLWCPSVIDAPRLHAARDGLAATCRAAEVRVMPSSGHARLVTLEVIRHQFPERSMPSPHRPPTRPPGAEPAEDLPGELALIERHGTREDGWSPEVRPMAGYTPPGLALGSVPHWPTNRT